VTVWDLHTGTRVDRTTDGTWEQRHPTFRARSSADGLTPSATEAGLTAGMDDGGLVLRDAASGSVLFRSPPPDTARSRAAGSAHGRVAFDGDGRHLLVVWEHEAGSQVDVHEI
jgi:hypothetical protein